MRFALNNRELAALIWLAAGLLWALARPDVRRALLGFLLTLLQPKILAALLSMASYSVGLVLLGSQVGLWDPDLTTEALIWFGSTAFVLLVRSNAVAEEPGFIRRVAVAAIGLTVIAEGLVNLFVFSLPVELVLLPALLFVVAMATVAERVPRYASVAKLVNGVLAATGVALLVYVGLRLTTGWGTLDGGALLRTLALPVWLTLGLLPFIAVVGLMGALGKAFLRVNWETADRRARRRAKIALVLTNGLCARNAGRFGSPWPERLASASSLVHQLSAAARGGVRPLPRGRRRVHRQAPQEAGRLATTPR